MGSQSQFLETIFFLTDGTSKASCSLKDVDLMVSSRRYSTNLSQAEGCERHDPILGKNRYGHTFRFHYVTLELEKKIKEYRNITLQYMQI